MHASDGNVYPLYTNGLFLLVWCNKLRIVHCTYLGVSGYFVKILYYFVWRSVFTFTNSVGPVEMQHYAAFYQGLYCLRKYTLKGFLNTKDYKIRIVCLVSKFHNQRMAPREEALKTNCHVTSRRQEFLAIRRAISLNETFVLFCWNNDWRN